MSFFWAFQVDEDHRKILSEVWNGWVSVHNGLHRARLEETFHRKNLEDLAGQLKIKKQRWSITSNLDGWESSKTTKWNKKDMEMGENLL